MKTDGALTLARNATVENLCKLGLDSWRMTRQSLSESQIDYTSISRSIPYSIYREESC